MSTPFAEAFSRLRKDRNISQRQAAEDMKVSQALLSHYENGIREPRLEFVVRACQYYNVSADYLLGRTDTKDNPMMAAGAVAGDYPVSVRDSDNIKNLINAVTVLYEIFESAGGDRCGSALYAYLSTAMYKMMRDLGIESENRLGSSLRLSDSSFSPLCDAAMKTAEAKIAEESLKVSREDISAAIDSIREKYPSVIASVEELAVSADGRIYDMFSRGESLGSE